MKHFTRSEFFTNGSTDNPETLTKIDNWINYLSEVRQLVGFKIKITDGVRFGEGTSQHYYRGNGAVDIRPVDRHDPSKMIALGLALAASKHITRVCYYPPSKRFPTGGFHCDRKIGGKFLFINKGVEIDWERMTEKEYCNFLIDSF